MLTSAKLASARLRSDRILPIQARLPRGHFRAERGLDRHCNKDKNRKMDSHRYRESARFSFRIRSTSRIA